MNCLVKWWRSRWARYLEAGRPWPWALLGAITCRLPGKYAAWHMNRQFAREEYGRLKMVWAEPYCLFWLFVVGVYENDGEQWGFQEIHRKPKTKDECAKVAHSIALSMEARIALEGFDECQPSPS